MNLPLFTLRKKTIVVTAVVLLFVFGLFSLKTNSRREDPEFTIATCTINCVWPGATAEDVENLVTDALEEAVDTMDEVDEITSTSYSGFGRIWVSLLDEIKPKDIDNIWDKLTQKIDAVRQQLPAGCRDPTINRDFGDTSSLLLGLYQDPASAENYRYTPRELEILAERLKDRLQLFESVARVDLFGVQDEAIYLETDLGAWSQLDVTTSELQTLLEQRNILLPGGSIDTEYSRFGVKPSGELDALRQIDRVVAGYGQGQTPVYLEDLGITVSRRYVEPMVRAARYTDPELDGSRDCIVLSVIMKAGSNVVQIGKDITALFRPVTDLQEDGYARIYSADLLPGDIRLALISNVPTIVNSAIMNFGVSVLQSIGLVVGVAFLLIGLRIAVVMAAAIPLVMVMTLGFMTFYGVELETMSIASLIIALGMLVDNAILVCDNTRSFLQRGYSKFDACVQGVQQVAFPMLIATLTTVCAFLPMLMIPGNMGEFIRSIPIVVSLALIISYFLAMTMTTLMAYLMLKAGKSKSPIEWMAQKLSALSRGEKKGSDKAPADQGSGGFEKSCLAAIRAWPLTIGISAVFFVASMSLLVTGKVETAFFPAGLRTQFVVYVDLPEGSPIGETDRAMRKIEKLLHAVGKGRLYNAVSYVGEGGPRFYLSLEPPAPASNTGLILINTHSPSDVDGYIADLRQAVDEGLPEASLTAVPGTRISIEKLMKGPPADPVAIRVLGPDMNRLRGYADEIKAMLRGATGTIGIEDDWGTLAYQLDVDIDEDAASLAGVTNAAVAQTLNAYFSGHYLTTFREGDHQVPVYLRLPAAQRGNLRGLRAIYVEGARGKVPLDTLARVKPTWQVGKIARRNLARCIEVSSNVEEGVLGNAIIRQITPGLQKLEGGLPAGYRIEIGGVSEESKKAQGHMARSFGISFLLIIMCLIVQFNSVGKLIIILMTLPLAAAGGIVGLYITGHPMGFMAMLGSLSLAGLVINVAIVLIEFIEIGIKEKIASGVDVAPAGERSFCGLTREGFRDCVIQGTKARILPISLTTLTTVGGLLPLGFGGDPFWQPLAFVLIFGLMVSGVLALFVIPTFYVVFVEVLRQQFVAPEGETQAARVATA